MANILIQSDPFQSGSLETHSLDGKGNNQANSTWGSAGSPLESVAPLNYADGISAPVENRPNPRIISNEIAQQNREIKDPQGLTNLIWAMGQFLDHDLDLTPALDRRTASAEGELMDIQVPTGDPYLDPNGTGLVGIGFQRSAPIEGTGTGDNNPRALPNEITAWIDGSNIYGSDLETANKLRSFKGGKLRVSSGNLLPINEDGGDENPNPTPGNQYFLAGDVRANENVVLTSMHTLWMREHNRTATALAKAHPDWTDQQLFERARQITVAHLQSVVFNEYLPTLLGQDLPNYEGYDNQINPGISRTFSTAAFRFGHTQVSSEIARLDNRGNMINAGNLQLSEAFFPDASMVKSTGIDPILRGVASTQSQAVDNKVIDDLRNLLFSFGGRVAAQDLMALNIQRGRDHGLADYNTTREAFGLARVNSFADMSSNPETQSALREIYGTTAEGQDNVNNIDAVVGMFAEDPINGGSAGATITAVLTDQFTRLRDGDRFYYENVFTDAEISAIEQTSLADIIRRNTNTAVVQDNVFTLKQTGTDGNDRINGGLGNDTIMGQQGHDTLLGYAGNDYLHGNQGRDYLNGDSGNDTLIGGGGRDRLMGRTGRDYLRGGNEADFLFGGAGSDKLDGGQGNDTVMGGSDNDFLIGGTQNDRLLGGGGNDKLLGTSKYGNGAFERDTLSGGVGNDTFILGNHKSVFYGADGNNDYALIQGFTAQDEVVLPGSRSDYSLGSVPRSVPRGVGLYHQTGDADPELIAVFQGYRFNPRDVARLEQMLFQESGDLSIEFGEVVQTPDHQGNGIVTVTMTNDSRRHVQGVEIDLFASTDTELDSTNQNQAAATNTLSGIDHYLGSLDNISLARGASRSFVIDFSSPEFQHPSGVAPGAYHLIAQVDSNNTVTESHENNNQAVQFISANGTDVVLDWNSTFLNAVQAEGKAEQTLEFDMQANSLDAIPGVAPPVEARDAAVLHLAIYDAVNALSDSSYASYLQNLPDIPAGASMEAAVVGAAHRVLTELFPEQIAVFDTQRDRSLSEIHQSVSAEQAGIVFGQQVAELVLQQRENDLSDQAQSPYEPSGDFGKYLEVNEAGLVTALLPKWGAVTPFVINDIQAFRPDGPPAYGSDDYAAELEQVRTLGGLNNTEETTLTRTDEQTEIARFWSYDRVETFRPPGQWNEIAQTVALQEGNSLLENARLFALLNVAMADGGIAAWDSKYLFEQLRPVTAIRKADEDMNPNTTPDLDWDPLLGTPNFPDYVSGHATFGGAAAGVLENFFGGDVEFAIASQELPGVIRTFTSDENISSFEQAALENANSRVYGGIHINSSNIEGLNIGLDIADYVANNFLLANDQVQIA